MNYERFHDLARETYGAWGYQRFLARKHGTSQAIVRRWCYGQASIPEAVIQALLDDAAAKIGHVAKLVRG
jgi:hypothetical protein